MNKISNIIKEVVSEVLSNDVIVGVSNRHVHLSENDLEILFGSNYKLNKMKDMKQIGQFAANETVTIVGPKGSFKNVRILGPTRKQTQVEISISDSYKLGIEPIIRQSGDLLNTPGVLIIGPNGKVEISNGVIVAGRHIHMPQYIASIKGYNDGDIVTVEVTGERGGILNNVMLRVGENMVKEMHIDIDEANAFGLKNNDVVKIMK